MCLNKSLWNNHRVGKMANKNARLSQPGDSGYRRGRNGILFVYYPSIYSDNMMVWSVLDHQELAYIIERIAVQRARYPRSYSLEDMLTYIGQEYCGSEIYTFADINNEFLEKVQKDQQGIFTKEAIRLGWVVEQMHNT